MQFSGIAFVQFCVRVVYIGLCQNAWQSLTPFPLSDTISLFIFKCYSTRAFLLHGWFCYSLCNHYLCILWAHFHSCFFDVVLIYDIICFHHIWREIFASLLKSVIWKVLLSKLYTDYLTNFAWVKISFISAAKLLECFAWRNQLLRPTREIWSTHNKNLSEIIGFDQTTSKQL